MIDPKSLFQPPMPLETRHRFSLICHWKRLAVAKALRAMYLTGGAANFFLGNGRLKFDENGRREGASLLIVQWQNGVPVTVYPRQGRARTARLAKAMSRAPMLM